jgi:hypothetical protein
MRWSVAACAGQLLHALVSCCMRWSVAAGVGQLLHACVSASSLFNIFLISSIHVCAGPTQAPSLGYHRICAWLIIARTELAYKTAGFSVNMIPVLVVQQKQYAPLSLLFLIFVSLWFLHLLFPWQRIPACRILHLTMLTKKLHQQSIALKEKKLHQQSTALKDGQLCCQC